MKDNVENHNLGKKSMWFDLKSQNGFLDKITAISCDD